MSKINRVIASGGGVIVLLHIWGALQPAQENWGVHFFAFYNPFISIAALALALLLFVPKAQSEFLQFFEKLVRPFQKLSATSVFLLSGGLLTGLFFLFATRGHLLGDSIIILRTTSWDPTVEDLTYNFRNQPLFRYLFHSIQSMIGNGGAVDPRTVYVLVDGIAGIFFLGLVILFTNALRIPPLEKVMIGVFLFFGAGTQFFFGYVENYVLLYISTALYIVSSWAALERKIHFTVPIFCFGLMIGLHLGAMIFLPSLLCLIYFAWRESKVEASVISALIIGIALLVFYMSGYSLDMFTQRIQQAFAYDFLAAFTPSPGAPYAMFSLAHLFEWFNANMLMGPYRLFITIVLLIFCMANVRRQLPLFIFLCVAAAGGLLFTFIMNPGLGMARDWDLMASFFLPLRFLSIFLILFLIPLKDSRYALTLVIGLTFIHWSAWIGINADEERHLQRAEIITDQAYMSPYARKAYYDRLGNAFWERKDYQRSLRWYEQYYQLDSTNSRILVNLSEAYSKLAYQEKAFSMLQRAATLDTANPGTSLNLGVMYAQRGDTASAIVRLQQTLRIDSSYAKAHANLGLIYSKNNNHAAAVGHLVKAISSGVQEPILYQKTANSYYYLHDYQNALRYYDHYLGLVPTDIRTLNVRNLLRDVISDSTRKQGQPVKRK